MTAKYIDAAEVERVLARWQEANSLRERLPLPARWHEQIPNECINDLRSLLAAAKPMPEATEDEVEACKAAYLLKSGQGPIVCMKGIRACLARLVEMRNE